METTRAPMASASRCAARPACSFLDENDFYSRCLCLIDELLQVFGRGLLAIFLYGELPQPEITSEVAQCRVVDEEGALMQAVEQPMDGDFERVDVV